MESSSLPVEPFDEIVSAGFAALDKRGFHPAGSDLGRDDMLAVFWAMMRAAVKDKSTHAEPTTPGSETAIDLLYAQCMLAGMKPSVHAATREKRISDFIAWVCKERARLTSRVRYLRDEKQIAALEAAVAHDSQPPAEILGVADSPGPEGEPVVTGHTVGAFVDLRLKGNMRARLHRKTRRGVYVVELRRRDQPHIIFPCRTSEDAAIRMAWIVQCSKDFATMPESFLKVATGPHPVRINYYMGGSLNCP